ncbi:MAG: glutamate-5-semialdehyde dehydrogenase [Wenzhouxiangella sp.]|jgi:glutamate-5-semialdehyde dehydrogenase|nr:glutamate-5-semialdehyde dehydrogenase [Wenzhouxiangella sp.]
MSTDHTAMMAALGQSARRAARRLAALSAQERRNALETAANALRQAEAQILLANSEDMEAARRRGLSGALLDRLELDPTRIAAMAEGLETVAALPDPVERVLAEWQRPNGLRIERLAVPIGVIGVIYESRPNVTADAAALCLKAGNAVILRGGSEAVNSNRAIHAVLQDALAACFIDPATVQQIPTQDRAAVGAMLGAHQWLDMVVPRGGKSLVARVQQEARVPVLAHLDGNNHLYIHPSADAAMAVAVVVNAKMRRPGICGALETLLVDRDCLDLLPRLVDELTAAGCRIRGDAVSRTLDSRIEAADDSDWEREYLDAILALRVVEGPEEALEHIARYGSGHTDGLIAEDRTVARSFLARLDSAIAVHNSSTQFADGGEFGFGAEIGIATGRLHARGPVGVEQLTTFQYRVYGSGQIRA